MPNSQQSLRIEDLLAQADWVTGLVRKLVRDADVADDIVQETWVRALENTPRATHGTSSIRLWLATVARRLVMRRAQSEQARKRREEVDTAAGDGPVDPAELYERVALQRDVANHVLALDEPHRTVIIMRFQDGCSAVEIASRLDISPEAARQRISRGLARLRARLEGRYGTGRNGWIAAVAPLFHCSEEVVVAGSVIAPLSFWLAAVLVTAAIGVGVWQLLPPPARGDETAVAAIESGRGDFEAGAAGRSDSGGASVVPSREVTTPVASVETQLNPGETDPQDLLADVDRSRDTHGVVVDGAGQPVGGVRLVAMTIADGVYDLAAVPGGELLAETHSNRVGAFVLRVPAFANVDVRVLADGFGTLLLPDRRAGERLRVQLLPAASLRCVLVDAVTGRALEGVAARLTRMWMGDDVVRELQRTTSAADGTFEMLALPPGRMVLEIATPGCLCRALVFTLAAGEQREERIEVAPGRTVAVTVVDAVSGDAIAGADVVASQGLAAKTERLRRRPRALAAGLPWAIASQAVTDAVGHARVVVPADFAFVQVAVRAAGYAAAVAAVPDVAGFTVTLQRGVSWQGVVVDSQRTPLADARVVAVAVGAKDGIEQADWQVVRTDAQGRFVVRHVRVDLPMRIEVQHDAHATRLLTPPVGGQDLGEIELSRSELLQGVVVGPDAQVSAGVYVRAMARTGVLLARVRTDDLGRFTMSSLPVGEITLRAGDARVLWVVGAAGGASSRDISDTDTPETGAKPVRLELRGQVVRGSVTDPNGQAMMQAMVILLGADPKFQKRTMMTDRFGQFAFEQVPAGTYAAVAAPNSVHLPGGDHMVHQVRVDEVVPGPASMRIVMPWAAATRGVVVDAQDQPQAHVMVFARGQHGGLVTYEFTDARGAFVLRLPPGAQVDLAVGKRAAHRIVLRSVQAGAAGLRVVRAN